MAVFSRTRRLERPRTDHGNHDSRALAGRPDRPVRVRQVHVRAQAFHADRGALVRLLPGLVADDENDQAATERRLRGAALRRRQAAGARPADGRRRDQRPAGGAQAAGRRWRAEYHVLPVAIVLDLPEARLPRAEPARGRIATSVRTSFAISVSSCGARCAAWSARASGTSTSCDRSRKSTRPTIERQPLWNNRKQDQRPVRHHRRRARLLRRAGRAARRSLGYVTTDDGDRVRYHPPGPQGGLRRRPGRPRAEDVRRAAAGDERWSRRHGAVRAGQSRHEAAAEAERQGRADHARAGRVAGAARRRDAGVPARRSRSSSTASSATTCSTTASWWSRTPGMKEEMQGRGSGAVRDFALYGETTGETDEFGLPVRYNWAAEYRGRRRWCTATRRCRSRSGSTARSTSTPAACSAAS